MTTRPSWPDPGEIQVAMVDLASWPSGPARLAAAEALLTSAERDRYHRYRRDVDRRMFLVGRVMAKEMVGAALGCDPMAWTWREGPRGRPEIADAGVTLEFNLAHSDGVVVCALADGRAVGVDVESMARRIPDQAIVDRYCAPTEVADIKAQGEAWLPRFLVYWTLKESYLKARGLGIGVPLEDISFDLGAPDAPRITFRNTLAGEDDRWAFTLWRPTGSHLVAVAAGTADGRRPTVTLRTLDP